MSVQSSVPDPQLPAAVTLCFCAYVDDPNQAPSQGSDTSNFLSPSTPAAKSNIQELVQSFLPNYAVVWSAVETSDYNYAFVAQSPDNNFFLAIRGSLPFEVDGSIVISWGVIYNWFQEDFNVFEQQSWPYSLNGGSPYVADGALDAFNSILTAADSMGSGVDLYTFLKQNAVQSGHHVYVTGHSLGGNIADTFASYFAYRLNQDGCSNDSNHLFTFAAPAAGSSDFVSDLQAKFPPERSYHYEMDNDIIPKFPVFDSMHNIVADLFSPTPQATDIDYTFLDIPLYLSSMIQTMAQAIWWSTDSPFEQTPITPAHHELSSAYTSNTFDDWFLQAAYQHQIKHYMKIFLSDEVDAKIERAAPSMRKSRSVYEVPTPVIPSRPEQSVSVSPPHTGSA